MLNETAQQIFYCTKPRSEICKYSTKFFCAQFFYSCRTFFSHNCNCDETFPARETLPSTHTSQSYLLSTVVLLYTCSWAVVLYTLLPARTQVLLRVVGFLLSYSKFLFLMLVSSIYARAYEIAKACMSTAHTYCIKKNLTPSVQLL